METPSHNTRLHPQFGAARKYCHARLQNNFRSRLTNNPVARNNIFIRPHKGISGRDFRITRRRPQSQTAHKENRWRKATAIEVKSRKMIYRSLRIRMANPILDWFGFTTQGDDMSNFMVATAAPGEGGESPLLDQRSAAKFLNLSVKTLYNLRMAGELPYVQIGDRILLYVADLHAFIQRKRKGGN